MRILKILSFFFLSFSLSAQSWNSLVQIGAIGTESIDDLQTDSDQHLYACGRFNSSFEIEGTTLENVGNADVFLLKMNADASLDWALSGGSSSLDASAGIALTETDIYWTGTYWLNATFGEIELTAEKSAKSIFLLEYNLEGEATWDLSIHGTGTKSVTDIKSDDQGNIYLTGSFSDSLFVMDRALRAKSETDLFVLKLNESHELLWLIQAGDEGVTLPERMAITSNGDIILAGAIQGIATFGDDVVETNTSDDDVFVARFSADGEGIWGRKAGGVHGQFCSALTLDEEENIYVGGNIIGVMKLSDDLIIQSPNLANNLFLLKYNADGMPIWAKSMGGFDPELVTDLRYKDEQLVLSGYFRESLEIDDFSATATPNLNTAFLASFDLTGQSQWVKVIKGDNQIFLDEIAFNHQTGEILGAGAFNGSLEFDNEIYETNGFYDVFIGSYGGIFTEVKETGKNELSFKISPNPASEFIFIKTEEEAFETEVVNIQGQVLLKSKNEKTIDVSRLPTGIYLLKIKSKENNSRRIIRFLKNSD